MNQNNWPSFGGHILTSRVLNEKRVRRQVIERKAERSWLAQVDDFRTFLGDFVSNVSQVELSIEMNR